MVNSKSEYRNTKQYLISQTLNPKRYDLEERTYAFSKNVFNYTKDIKKDAVNYEIVRQLIRSAGSVGANYIEANESLGRKDFLLRIKICKKEAKESCYWLKLSEAGSCKMESIKDILIDESVQLMKIFGAILERSK